MRRSTWPFRSTDDDTVVQTALADEKIARFLEKTGGALRKSIVVKNKLVNLIVK